jgi:hypothetical protein
VAALLVSCAPTTRLVSSWSDPASTALRDRKVVVVGVLDRSTLRRPFESAFVAELERRGVPAVAGYTLLGEGRVDPDSAAARLRENGVWAVLLTCRLDSDAPSGASGSQDWYGDYSRGLQLAETVESPVGVYRLQSSLHDLASGRRDWSGITETTLQAGDHPADEVRPIIEEVLAGLHKSKLLPSAKH